MADWCTALRDRSWQTLAEVATRLHEAGRVPQTARAWHDAALAAATIGDEPGARKLAATAFAGYDRIGAEQLHRQLRHDLREHGVAMRPRRAAARPASGWDGLTDSERRVVDLVGEGLTNSEIGERLFVSRRTVESHLARVYTKTGVRSRGELIASVTRRSDPIA
jgi:DNA-binding CsgD family transcriptional regulator